MKEFPLRLFSPVSKHHSLRLLSSSVTCEGTIR